MRFDGHRQATPDAFLGISIEYNELSGFEDAGSLFDRALELIRPATRSPMLLRLGGRSANYAYWETPIGHAPHSVFELDDAWMRRLAVLARRDHLVLLPDLNLAVHSPTMAVRFTRAMLQTVGRARVAALAIGQRANLYHRQPSRAQVSFVCM